MSRGTHLGHRLQDRRRRRRPAPARGHPDGPAPAPGGRPRPVPDAARRAGHHRAARADHPERPRGRRARPAPHRHPRDCASRGAGPRRAPRRPERRPLLPRIGHPARRRAAQGAAEPQDRLPRRAARRPAGRRRPRARPRRGDPRAGARGGPRVTVALRRSVASLSVPNYRRYFTGQVVSLSGNWMQTVAEMWLIVRLTENGIAVGLTAALQFLPILLFGAYGGLLADRFPKRKVLMTTQAMMALPALALWALAASGHVEAWMVFALVFARGAVNALDNPTRQSFVIEMVGGSRVVNAVSLNSVLVHSARIAGPALAGVVIATAGVAPCFLVNALSFGAMIVALWRMDPRALSPAKTQPRAPGQVRAALRYVRRTPALAVPLALMAAVSTLALNFQVLLPLVARFTFHGTASTYAALTSAMAVGAVIGALVAGWRSSVTPRLMVLAATAFGVATLLAAVAPALGLMLLLLPLVGAASVTFTAGVNSGLQLAVAPEMRGRVMALYSVVFLGSTPIGGPLSGWLAEATDPRWALAAGGVATLVAAVAARWAFIRAARRAAPAVPARDEHRVEQAHEAGRVRGRAGRAGTPSAPAGRSSRWRG